jgi:hypothetical protein
MEDRAYVLRLPDGLAPPKRDAGCPPELLLRSTWLTLEVPEIVGAPLWIASTQGQRCFLWGCVKPEIVLEVTDPPAMGDFVLQLDASASWQIGELIEADIDMPAGTISPVASSKHQAMLQMVISRMPVSYRSRHRAPSLGEQPTDLHSLRVLCTKAVAFFASRYSLLALGRSAKHPGLSPLGAAALGYLMLAVPDRQIQELLDIVSHADPLVGPRSKAEQMFQLPLVDVAFVPIDPAHLRSRTFVASGVLTPTNVTKMERSERQHQLIVSALAAEVARAGYHPLQSDSIDLCLLRSQRVQIFEVKSAAAPNFFDQLAKGVLQLHRYAMALLEQGECVETMVIVIEAPRSTSFRRDARVLANNLGVKLVFIELSNMEFDGLDDILCALA